jgi:hypothetical protein
MEGQKIPQGSNGRPKSEELDDLPIFSEDWLDELDETIERIEHHLEETTKLLGLPPLEPL